ncbi:MAG: hypothetical protein CV087_06850 [Candidatus Brocadia sp. WS118]|nr:MAG: hypothetical protein CV087_06850 [Candidatus Brocadia sp. WS118]
MNDVCEIPKNLDAEKAIIAILFNGPRSYDQIFSTIKPGHFSSDQNRELYQECFKQHSLGKPIDLITLSENIDVVYVTECLAYAGHSYTNLEFYIDEVMRTYRLRKLLGLGQEIQRYVIEKNACPEKISHKIEEEIINLAGKNTSPTYSIKELVDQFGNEEHYVQMRKSCIATGFLNFDRDIIVKPGDLIILAGRPSMGKTAFMLAVAKGAAKNDHTGLIFSLEMRSDYLLHRLAISEEPHKKGYEAYSGGCQRIYKLPLYITDESSLDIPKIRNRIRMLKSTLSLDVIFIDYLSLLDPPPAENRNLAIGEITRGLKLLAKEIDIPVFLLSQLNRKVEERNLKKPQLSDLRDSGSIEQDSDIVLFCYRPAYYGIETDQYGESVKNLLELIVAKQRDGKTGSIGFYYDLSSQSIESLIKEPAVAGE